MISLKRSVTRERDTSEERSSSHSEARGRGTESSKREARRRHKPADNETCFHFSRPFSRDRWKSFLCAELESFDASIGVPFEPVRQLLLVYQQHGGPWDWSKDLRDQQLFDEHARFVDGLVDEGLIILGGPLSERDVLLVVQSETEASVRSRFGADPWIENGMLTITAIRPWTIFLEGRL